MFFISHENVHIRIADIQSYVVSINIEIQAFTLK